MAGIAARFVPAPPKPDFDADFGIDGHSHIESGATCPLPLIWHQQATLLETTKPERWFLDLSAPIVLGHGGKVQRLTTEQIGDVLIVNLKETYDSECKLRVAKPYKKCKEFYTPVVIMPMDMDYAHIAGFPP